jgi:glycosyltransferase involved in cell wall biosynthesis
MQRICTALTDMGYTVVLVGRLKRNSLNLLPQKYLQHRIRCYFNKGFLFYAEFNLRLWIYLLIKNPDIVYSVDMDTLLAGWSIKKLKRKKLIFDAHEYFSEVPELIHRPVIKKIWSWLENFLIPSVDKALTVSLGLSAIFSQKWHTHFNVILNVPDRQIPTYTGDRPPHPRNYILYQGMLNEGRGIEEMMDALPLINEKCDFVIIGEGDLSQKLREKAASLAWSQRIIFLGWLLPHQIKTWTNHASLGINLLNAQSLSYTYSLANKFFDYLHAGIPSVNSDLPEYREIISNYPIGYLVPDLKPVSIASVINTALLDDLKKNKKNHFLHAISEYNWENEKISLKKMMESL